jgi:hypothetical protein
MFFIRASQECGRERYFSFDVKKLQHFGEICVFRIFCKKNQKRIELKKPYQSKQRFLKYCEFLA